MVLRYLNLLFILVLTSVLICIFPVNSFSQDLFTLDNAIQAGLEYNHAVQIKSIETDKAYNRATRGNAGLLPTIGITGESEQTYGSIDLVPGNFFRDLIGQQGGQVPSEISYDGVSTTTLNAGFGVEMVLYNGRVGQIRYRLLQAGQEAASLKLQDKMEQTVLEITGTYVQTALYQESLKLQKEELRQSRDRYLRLKEQQRYGQVTEQQLLQAHADLKNDSTSFRNLKHLLENAKRDLDHMIGSDSHIDTKLKSDLRVSTRFEFQDLIQRARKENRVIQMAELQSEMSADEIEMARSSGLPMLTASARYGYNYRDASEGQFETQEQLGVTGGLTLRIPLFQGGRTSTAIQNARLEKRQLEIRQELTRDRVEVEVENQYNRFGYLINRLEKDKSNLAVYERNYERAVQANRQGLVTGLELRNAQISLHKAQLQITRKELELKLVEFGLLYMSGQLLSLVHSPGD